MEASIRVECNKVEGNCQSAGVGSPAALAKPDGLGRIESVVGAHLMSPTASSTNESFFQKATCVYGY